MKVTPAIHLVNVYCLVEHKWSVSEVNTINHVFSVATFNNPRNWKLPGKKRIWKIYSVKSWWWLCHCAWSIDMFDTFSTSNDAGSRDSSSFRGVTRSRDSGSGELSAMVCSAIICWLPREDRGVSVMRRMLFLILKGMSGWERMLWKSDSVFPSTSCRSIRCDKSFMYCGR